MPEYRSVASHPFTPDSGLNVAPGDVFTATREHGDTLVRRGLAVEHTTTPVHPAAPAIETVETAVPASDADPKGTLP